MVHHRREGSGVEASALRTDAVAGLARLDGFVRLAPFHVEEGSQAAGALVYTSLKLGQPRDDTAAHGMDQQVQGGVAAVAHDLTLPGRSLQPVQVRLQALAVCLV